MPNDQSNFTLPDTGSTSGGAANVQRPAGTGDNGETWDPVQQRWVPRSQMPAVGTTGTGTAMGIGNTNSQGGMQGAPVNEGRIGSNNSWGGYGGTVVKNPDGSLSYDQSLNGANADTLRYQSMGAAAAGRGAYQNDYSMANGDAMNGAGARIDQGNAIGLARAQALNGNAASQQLGQRMLTQGAQAQQAAALSTRGGGLGAVAALRSQQNGQGAYVQQGQNALAAQKADDMAAGRTMYQQQATAQRAGDVTAQGLHQEQSTSQEANELGQRQLNDQTQQGYEGLAQNVQHAQQQGGLQSEKTDAGIYDQTSTNDQNDKDRAAAYGAAGLSAMGTLFAKGAAASDARTKQAVRPMNLGAAALARKERY